MIVQRPSSPAKRLAPDWSLLAGVTWTTHTYDLSEDPVGDANVRVDYDYLLPRLGVNWRPAHDWSVYANLSRGGREPAFRDIYDPHIAAGDEVRDLDPEELTDLEVGVQRVWPAGYARGNLYWLDFDNAIVFAGGIDEDGLPTTANGAVVTQWGAELEATWTPIPRWGGRLALSYTDATFDDFVEFDFSGGVIDHSGNRVAGVSDWLATLELTGGIGAGARERLDRHHLRTDPGVGEADGLPAQLRQLAFDHLFVERDQGGIRAGR